MSTSKSELIYSETKKMPNPDENHTLMWYISSVFQERKKEANDKGKSTLKEEKPELFSQENVAKRLGISKSMLRKKLYHKNTSREWIIAICTAYGLNSYEIIIPLTKYGWPSLDNQVDREKRIENFLDDLNEMPSTLKKINVELESAGYSPLQIQKRGEKSIHTNKSKSNYTQADAISVKTSVFDPYDSLETKYLPYYRVSASVIVKSLKNEYFKLWATSDEKYLYQNILINDKGKIVEKGRPLESTIEHPDFEPFFKMLLNKRKEKLQMYDNILNDSKNYQGRFSANLKEFSLHVFYEEYNYAFPERNEYFLMEYWKGTYTLSVANKSMFMQEFMSREDYYNHYHKKDTIERKTYCSLEDIDEKLSQSDNWYSDSVISNYKSTFLRLKKLLKSKIKDIQTKKLFICNFDAIWEIPENVLKYYNIGDIFKCEYDADGDICNCIDTVTIEAGTTNEVILTFDDVKAAFECGFKNFDEICEYKRSHKSITDVLM